MAGSQGATVVLALDGSDHSHHALEYYLEHIHKEDNYIVLVNVIDIPENANEARQKMLSGEAVKEIWEEQSKEAAEREKKYAEFMRQKGVHSRMKIKLEGSLNAGHSICKVAEEEKALMIVMGTRGMGKIRRTILGSVSDYVVHHAHCGVVIVKQDGKNS